MTGSDMDFRQLMTSLRSSLLTLDLSQNIFPEPHLDALCLAYERAEWAEDAPPPLSDLNLSCTNVEYAHVGRIVSACKKLTSLDLSGSRALPRNMKKLYEGAAVQSLLPAGFAKV